MIPDLNDECALCGHPEALHSPRCLAWETGRSCGCPGYEPPADEDHQ
ncbi:hypothetical protein PBI_BUTTERS_58 [Mycobacterium phage Butters]|uniref:Uncharacterized protein n=2 Tax=Charlievirus butters TaxID=2169798 RepID=A0A2Z5HEX2_9CAUD|nr:hypothetical protein K768_gp58 [Mycobacterium phage Butters]AXC38503.1 hypothetical protein SEA_RUBEELU_58 [Mycobacterium phage Rubeelu]WAW19139.1 hypothetical protein BIB10_53 [Mycobacterium phage BIB10]WAW19201.1 hypothetical protein BIB9_53 [Mycobacterium phage BIB9]WAW19263.1 hypothetical protein BIB8_53 [Mycobacterium phage BIB8]WAW19325.1 hypothetical protein BIB7_53 [Mycobacterium phage BIB7]WAW19387.1 hypothetical protein BIB6_53 [Mycobacterium phage BIB6]WAW19449.1 hypothetical p